MRPIVIIYCMVSLFFAYNALAEPDDFLTDFGQTLLDIKEIKIPLDKITDFNTLKKPI